MTNEVNVLDGKGYVKLVDHLGGDSAIMRAARGAAPWAGEDEAVDPELIARLVKDQNHLAVVQLALEIKAPSFVLRQWHRTWLHSEVPPRYVELEEDFYTPERIGKQSKLWIAACENAFDAYKSLVANGVPKEIARGVLPAATFAKMSARAFLGDLFYFLGLRINNHAQPESQAYARAILELITPIAPVTVAAWKEFCVPADEPPRSQMLH